MPDGKTHRYCLLQYSFKGGREHSIEKNQHGNTKSAGKPYLRTWASTKDAIKSATENLNPREVIYNVVNNELGGVARCSSYGHIPRNRQQVKDFLNAKKKAQNKNLSGHNEHDDPWFRLLGENKKQANDRKKAFIRDVRVAPEPLGSLRFATRQLDDAPSKQRIFL